MGVKSLCVMAVLATSVVGRQVVEKYQPGLFWGLLLWHDVTLGMFFLWTPNFSVEKS